MVAVQHLRSKDRWQMLCSVSVDQQQSALAAARNAFAHSPAADSTQHCDARFWRMGIAVMLLLLPLVAAVLVLLMLLL